MDSRDSRTVCTALVFLFVLLAVPAPDCRAQILRAVTAFEPLRASYSAGALDDAGGLLYFSSNQVPGGGSPALVDRIWEVNIGSGTQRQVTAYPEGAGAPAVSDDGQWLVFLSAADPLGTNADHGVELFTLRPDGTMAGQLTAHPAAESGAIASFAFAGSGNRVAFVSTTDPLGTNPGGVEQIFVVNRDGTGLAQLTSFATADAGLALSISDDGLRIAFAHAGNPLGTNPDGSREIFAVNADGSGLRQLTTALSGDSVTPALSGNGAKITFASTATFATNPFGHWRVMIVDWSGAGLSDLTGTASPLDVSASYSPSITDDATTILFTQRADGVFNVAPAQVWRMNADGSGKASLTATAADNTLPVVAGGGGRLVWTTGGPFPPDLNPDGAPAVLTMNDLGSDVALVVETETKSHRGGTPDLTPDASRVVFTSNANETGANPERRAQIHRIEGDGSGLAQVTSVTGGDVAFLGGVTDDGGTIVFETAAAWVAGDPSLDRQVFAIQADGSGLRSLNPPSGYGATPAVAGDGSHAVFQDGSGELYRVGLDGTGLLQLTADGDTTFKLPRVDAGGTWVVFQSPTNVLGGNADGSLEIYRVRTDGTGLERLTGDAVYDAEFPDLSTGGARVVYSSWADPLGTNPENNEEIFLVEPATSTTLQLTQTASGGSWHPRISDDGAFVYFKSDAPIFEAGGGVQPYRVEVSSGVIERVGGLSAVGLVRDGWEFDYTVSPGADGEMAVVFASGDHDGSNPDGSEEIWIVDFPAPAPIEVGPAMPTLLSWPAGPRPLRYDVIRGDVAALAPGGGGTVDLGTVLCVEDDSTDNRTLGHEDPDVPAPGQAFFYLRRGSQGVGDGPGSWGQGSGGSERIAASGDCPS